jgi:hypothetical protein
MSKVRVVVGDLWVTGWDRERCRWRPVGDRLGSGELLLETFGWQVQIGRVVVGDLLVTNLYPESSCWRDVDHKFESGELHK